VIHHDDAPVVEDNGSVFPRDRLAPPFVVDSPALAYDRDAAGGLAR
jgi:hypothetical protein